MALQQEGSRWRPGIWGGRDAAQGVRQCGAIQVVIAVEAVEGLKLGRQRHQPLGFMRQRLRGAVGKVPGFAREQRGSERVGDGQLVLRARDQLAQLGVFWQSRLDRDHGRTLVEGPSHSTGDAATIAAMVRVFVDAGAISGGELHLTGADAQHLGGALRLQPHEELVAVSPDEIEHRCQVTSASATEVVARVLDSNPSRREPSRRVRLCQALLKGDQFDRILEYAGELGVESVQPLITERTVARPNAAKLAARHKRWQQIVRQGAELGQRGRLPKVLPAAALAEATEAAAAGDLQTFLLYEGAGLPSLSAADLGDDGVCIIVGPEGGWSDAEVKLAERAGAPAVSLGPRVMRPLPAALTALAVLYHRSGDLELKED